ncbi:NAD(P)H-binding protein [Streptomyces sp. NPDC002888]|uniref:NAD(P)H-binding protein n=1 Tax=Streptomyces sp. NPDC002888 TaxID=3364668 RepID=UPI0036BA84E7
MVRPTTDASRLENRGVEIARGDMLDLDSLVAAMNGADAVITTAAGYTRGGKNAHDIPRYGSRVCGDNSVGLYRVAAPVSRPRARRVIRLVRLAAELP